MSSSHPLSPTIPPLSAGPAPSRRRVSAAELGVLDRELPLGLAEGMHELALCLFEALVLLGTPPDNAKPEGPWLEQLRYFVRLVLAQLEYLSREMGGRGNIYIARGLEVGKDDRDRAILAAFNGQNFNDLAAQHGLTPMRVRQIVARENRRRRKGALKEKA